MAERTRGSIHVLGLLHYRTVPSTTTVLNTWTYRVRSHVHRSNISLHAHEYGHVTYDAIQQDGRRRISGNASFLLFCYCLSNWRHEITTVKYIIDCRWKQTWTDELRLVQTTVESKRLFLVVGARTCECKKFIHNNTSQYMEFFARISNFYWC